MMKQWILIVALAVSGCGGYHVPPNLSPEARVAYVNLRVVKPLDLVRDIAQDGSQIQGSGISVATAVTVSQWHKSAVLIMDSAAAGWQGVVLESLNELFKNLTTAEQRALKSYFSLVATVIGELR